MPPPNPKQKTRKFGVGGGHLFPVPMLWGWSVCPPSSILLMLPLQITCSLVVANLMSNSCAPPPPPPPTRLREIKKRLQSLECCHAGAYVIGLGVNEKVQSTGEPMPNFFSKVWALLFPSIFCFKFKAPHPLTRALLFF